MHELTRNSYINGSQVDSSDVVDIISPVDGSLVGRLGLASVSDVNAACETALSALDKWRSTHADERCRVLSDAARRIRVDVDNIAAVLTAEQGKPLADSRKEILFGAQVLEYYGQLARTVGGSLRPTLDPDQLSMVSYTSVGVVAAIVPWNYPVDLYCWKVAPALAAGCTVVGKPPIEASFSIGMVVQHLYDAGLPTGALSDLPGGTDIGQSLVAHPAVSMITATCSTAAGKAIQRSAAESLKSTLLELGGHCPLIVLDDADLPLAAAAAARRSFSNMGQICIAVNRVIVHDSVADKFVELLTAAVAQMQLGDPRIPGVTYGPCTTADVVEKSMTHIADALDVGGKLIIGGSRPEGAEFSLGHYLLPTVIDHVPLTARIMSEETFGPVLAVHRVPSVADAITVANGPDYGLAAYIYGENLERSLAVAERIDSGGVAVNLNDVSELQAPFGGWKGSGLGRELGPEGLHSYLKAKHTKVRRRNVV